MPSSPRRRASEHGIRAAPDVAAARCAATSTSSPRSTTRPGRRTGASCPTTRRTSTPTRRSCSSSSTATGSWSPRRTRASRSAWRSPSPDVNQVLAQMNGRLLPLGWWHFLRSARSSTGCRVGFLGVKPEYQHTGVAAQLYVEHFDVAEVAPRQRRRDGLDPRDQHAHEPRHGGDGRPDRQALPHVRAALRARTSRRPGRPTRKVVRPVRGASAYGGRVGDAAAERRGDRRRRRRSCTSPRRVPATSGPAAASRSRPRRSRARASSPAPGVIGAACSAARRASRAEA